jgi:hypothetical protein
VLGVRELGKPYYGRCIHLRTAEAGDACGCAFYANRPNECREYRCAWHLGCLGPRTDRRPRESGLLVNLEPEQGRWRIDVYQTRPDSTPPDRIRFLAQQVMSSKRARHLPFHPEIRFFPFGSDVPVVWAVSEIYPFDPPQAAALPVKRESGIATFAGKIRGFMMPANRGGA